MHVLKGLQSFLLIIIPRHMLQLLHVCPHLQPAPSSKGEYSWRSSLRTTLNMKPAAVAQMPAARECEAGACDQEKECQCDDPKLDER